MEAWRTDLGPTGSSLAKLRARKGSSELSDGAALTGDQVLAFLRALRLDRRRCSSLNSGRNLLFEAAEAGLVDLGELDVFHAQMMELRRAGLIGWTSGRHDIEGDDLSHAAEFHVTEQGRRRLEVRGDGAGLAMGGGHGTAVAEGGGSRESSRARA